CASAATAAAATAAGTTASRACTSVCHHARRAAPADQRLRIPADVAELDPADFDAQATSKWLEKTNGGATMTAADFLSLRILTDEEAHRRATGLVIPNTKTTWRGHLKALRNLREHILAPSH